MRRARANISIFDFSKVTGHRELIIQAISPHSSICKEVSASQVMLGNSCDIINSIVNVFNLNSNALYPLFLLTFEIFNYNVYNYLVDLGASPNVMSLSVAKKINAKRDKTNS